jgi:hypothetical protein
MGNSLSYNIRNRDNNDNDTNNDNTSNIGNTGNNNESLLKVIDEIASNYMFKQNVVDMLRFSDSDYRDNFVILTCRILDEKLTNLDIGTLKDRITNTNVKPKNTNHGELVYFSELEKMKPLLYNEDKKKEALLIISKFYVKIFTLFSSIVSVVDPQYTYKDENGEDNYFYLKDYDDLKMVDLATNKLKLYHLENPLSLVRRRLFILKNKLEQQDENSDYIVMNPGEELCSMNIPENNEGDFKLSNEIGIKELDNLYYDLYDEETSEWSGRSKEMEEQYKRDVALFFRIFTGKKKKPANVTSFSDIELLDFHNLTRCKNNDYFEDLLVSKNDVLFQKYISKIEEIQQGTRSYKKQLLYILKSMFMKHEQTEEDDDSFELEYTIHPELDMKKLSEKQKMAQSCIVQMYTNCEKNFIEALLLYEKMYENRYGELVEAQVKSFAFTGNNKNNGLNASNEYSNKRKNNLILNGNLLLNEKIKMPNMSSNQFKVSNKPSAQESSTISNVVPAITSNNIETVPTSHIEMTSPENSVQSEVVVPSMPVPTEKTLPPPIPDPSPIITETPPTPTPTPPTPTPTPTQPTPTPTPTLMTPTETSSFGLSENTIKSEQPIEMSSPQVPQMSSVPSPLSSEPIQAEEIQEEPTQQEPIQSEEIPQSNNNINQTNNNNSDETVSTQQESPNDLQKEFLENAQKRGQTEEVNKISLGNSTTNRLNSNVDQKKDNSIESKGEGAQRSLKNTFSSFFS